MSDSIDLQSGAAVHAALSDEALEGKWRPANAADESEFAPVSDGVEDLGNLADRTSKSKVREREPADDEEVASLESDESLDDLELDDSETDSEPDLDGDLDDDDQADEDIDDDSADEDPLEEFDPKDVKRYDDVRAYANRLKAELDAVKAREAAAAQPAAVQPQPQLPQIDAVALLDNPQVDPWAVFDHVQQTDPRQVPRVIARIDADAKELAAAAAAASMSDDPEQAALAGQYRHAARQASELAETMRAQNMVSTTAAVARPMQERDFVEDVKLATQRVASSLEASDQREIARYDNDIQQHWMSNMERFVGDGSPAALEQGIRAATDEVLGRHRKDIVNRQLKAAAEANRRKAAKAKRAAGDSRGSRAPQGEPTETDTTREETLRAMGRRSDILFRQ